MSNQIVKIPTLQELVTESEISIKVNALMVILNQEPPKTWLKKHPTATKKIKKPDGSEVTIAAEYLPIERVEYLLSRIFIKWWVEVKSTSIMANSVCVTIRLYVINPITNETEWNDGVGAKSIQTKKGAGAMDWQQVQDAGVMMALPSAESYAIKDAAEKWGKLFGKDINRQDEIEYGSLLKQYDWEALNELKELKSEQIPKEEIDGIERVINTKEVKSYKKVFNYLSRL